MLTPEIKLHRAVFPADVQQPSAMKEEQEWSSSLQQRETKPLLIKEEEEELRSGQEEEQLQTREPQSGSDSVEKRKSTGPDTNMRIPTETYSQAEIEVKLEDSSGSETEDSEDDWRETGHRQTCLNPLRLEDVPQRATPDKNQVLCSHSDETFNSDHSLNHMIVKEEPEEVWIGQADTYKFSPVKREGGTDGEDRGGPGPHVNMKDETESDINSAEKRKDNPNAEEMSHSCSQCGKTFKHKQSLSIHMTVHTGEKPFSCSECGKRFNRKGSLTRHMLLYRGEKPFSCSVCGKSFSRKWHLTRHVSVHEAEKPFSCSVCSVRFSRESGLTLHMAFHRGERPYSCSV